MLCDRRVAAKVKGMMYKVAVRQTMMFGLETLAVTKRHMEDMETAEMKILRYSLGVTKLDR